jgi:hypothetical protein
MKKLAILCLAILHIAIPFFGILKTGDPSFGDPMKINPRRGKPTVFVKQANNDGTSRILGASELSNGLNNQVHNKF